MPEHDEGESTEGLLLRLVVIVVACVCRLGCDGDVMRCEVEAKPRFFLIRTSSSQVRVIGQQPAAAAAALCLVIDEWAASGGVEIGIDHVMPAHFVRWWLALFHVGGVSAQKKRRAAAAATRKLRETQVKASKHPQATCIELVTIPDKYQHQQ